LELLSAGRPVNVLITAAGRRTSLVQAFVDAAQPAGGKVVAADVDPLAPALYVANRSRRLPSWGADGYEDALLDVVESEAISLVVPTNDPELAPLARMRGALAERGCTALVSDESLIQISGDKLQAAQAFAQYGIRMAATWLPKSLPVVVPPRLFVKPRFGSASIAAHETDPEGLADATSHAVDAIVQEYVDAPEVSVDLLLDLGGRPIHYVPRLRIRTLAGESIQARTLPTDGLHDWIVGMMEILGSMGGRGPLTVQAFLTGDQPTLSEVNPRFAGGFPLTNAAGGRYPEWLVRKLSGKPTRLVLGDYEVGLIMTRSFQERFLREPRW
jgi:carbamoyl-phosphate synthase large subunit